MDRAREPSGEQLLHATYDALLGVLVDVSEDDSWNPTGCRGWAVRDLTHHLLADARRALVALHTPRSGPADRDAVGYWRDWTPDPLGAAQGRRHTRVGASMFLDWDDLRADYVGTARAVAHAARHTGADRLVGTQGHVLSVEDLLSTLSVEATIHHLDLVRDLPGAAGPSGEGLTETRRVLDGLLGAAAAAGWSTERYVLVATGRADPEESERRDLGDLVDRLPALS